MLLHKDGKFTMGKLKRLFCRNIVFLTGPHYQFRGEGEGILYFKLYLKDVNNKICRKISTPC
jgi:hypothetical protein